MRYRKLRTSEARKVGAGDTAPLPCPSVDIAPTIHAVNVRISLRRPRQRRAARKPRQASCIIRQYSYFIIAVEPAMMDARTTKEPSDSVDMPVTP